MSARLPYNFAKRNGILIADGPNGGVEAHHVKRAPLAALVEAQRVSGPGLRFHEVSDERFAEALGRTYRDSASDAAEEAAAADTDLAAIADSAAAVDDLLERSDDAPVVRLINAILLEAVKEGASDIHVETQEKRLVVRFRIDGVLRDVIEPKRSLAPLLVSRIKVMARLDIAEKRVPHDGRVSLRVGGQEIDVRVSTLPAQYGERVVMRLLNRDAIRLDVDSLGMAPGDLQRFKRLLDRPDGIILVTGPTGSGKTTTLYSSITRLNDRKRNIMTVEDPIEYSVEGTAQTQVNPRTEMTFARGLRAILRQDPDVIMVGEIRDRETAETAVQAAMTGHLVLSTLHTNSAIGSVTRLIDMGVERFLLSATLTGLAAQRLVRTLCPSCKRKDTATALDKGRMHGLIREGEAVWRAQGCDACFGEGYRGRTGIYEVVDIDGPLQALIHDGASEAALTGAAREQGGSLLADGAAKIREGLTSIEEAARVAYEE